MAEWVLSILELPRVVTLVVKQAWVVATFVEVFEDAGKDLGQPEIIVSESKYGSAWCPHSSGSSTRFDVLL